MKAGIFTLVLLMVFSAFGREIENTMSSDFYNSAKKVEGFHVGVDQSGRSCHVLVKELIYENPLLGYKMKTGQHRKIHLLISGQKLADEVLNAQTEEEAINTLKLSIKSEDINRKIRDIKAGWCEGCGSAHYDGRVGYSILNNSYYLSFYAQGYTPANDLARIYLSDDGNSVEKIEVFDYSSLYFPVVGSPVKNKFTCNITK